MRRKTRSMSVVLVVTLAIVLGGCHKNNVQNPIANLDSKQPDKVLFDRAMEAMKKSRYETARLTLQTMINTYPDSEYIARAKLAVGDSWYAENTSVALTQAEAEYKDFITFFPNMPEAAEAQLKVAGIHYRQMEKPDRDYTHAKRAEEEYRQMLQMFPDSKLVPEAKQRLLEVQEVLAEREFRIGRFYYLRESWAAAIARLKSMSDAYPLYSGADETLMMLGDSYEHQMEAIRGAQLPEAQKAKLLEGLARKAGDAYARVVTRYPAMGKAQAAKERLQALHLPVPKPTAEAMAQSEAEEKSRREITRMARVMANFKKHPDLARATKVGEPTVNDPPPTNATDVINDLNKAMVASAGGNNTVSVETIKGSPPPNEPTPRSDAGTSTTTTDPGASALPPGTAPAGAAPAQVNDVRAETDPKAASDAKDAAQVKADQESTSKKKKKKGLRKIIPF